MRTCLLVLALLSPLVAASPIPSLFSARKGTVTFSSEAPLETIVAKSSALKGVIDTEQNSFAFTMDVSTFEGFNSPLQREHFNENYLETKTFRKASFTGKIIEQVNFGADGTYSVRAKGELDIHGVRQERIIKSEVTVKNGHLHVHSSFSVLLSEHDIAIPKIVNQKIAEAVQVTVDAEFEKQ